MSFKSRLLRLVLTLLAVLAFVGYFAFSTFLFSPTEDDYEADLSTLVPRNVDFFLAKARLAQDFDPFPRLAVGPRIAATPAWRAFFESDDYAELSRQRDPQALLAELERQVGELKGIDPLEAFGGRDLALAGWVRGPDLSQADWAAYGRVSWIGKLAVSLLSYPRLLRLSERGLSVAVEEDHVALSGGELSRPIFVTRVRDVVVAGTSLELVRKARELEARAGQDSLGQGAVYDEHIHNSRMRAPARNELELFVDWRSVSEKAQLSGRWPDPQSPFQATALAARFFQLGAIKELSGVIGFDRGIKARLHASLSSEMVGPTAARTYRQRGADLRKLKRQADLLDEVEPRQKDNKPKEPDTLKDVASMAPGDTGLFVYVHVSLGDLLRELLETAEPALRSNLDDLLRSTGKYQSAEVLIAEIDSLFRGRAALIVRRNDYPVAADDPPNDGTPVFALALVLWTDGSEKARAKIGELRTLVQRNQSALGLQGREPGTGGVFSNQVETGHEVWEYWSPLVPGTGHLADVIDGRQYILSNSWLMLGHLIATQRGRATEQGSLTANVAFQGLVEEGLDHANALVWLAPRQLAQTAREQSERAAQDAVLGGLDLPRERVRMEALALRQDFGGRRIQELSPDEKARLDEGVDAQMDEWRKRLVDEQVPALRDAYLRLIQYAEACQAALLMVSLDPKWMELSLGVITPLETP